MPNEIDLLKYLVCMSQDYFLRYIVDIYVYIVGMFKSNFLENNVQLN